MNCRSGCAACCIIISISSEIPGMPNGKPAGIRCIQLNERNECLLFGKPERPKVCLNFSPTIEMCGDNNEYAFNYLSELEKITG
ncbi:MAG: YkgJ family cysteine cluster protein [Candidatus Wallbacteria bacterium]